MQERIVKEDDLQVKMLVATNALSAVGLLALSVSWSFSLRRAGVRVEIMQWFHSVSVSLKLWF